MSDVYAPVAGVVAAVNEALTDAPETINADPYGAGWLVEITLPEGAGEGDITAMHVVGPRLYINGDFDGHLASVPLAGP